MHLAAIAAAAVAGGALLASCTPFTSPSGAISAGITAPTSATVTTGPAMPRTGPRATKSASRQVDPRPVAVSKVHTRQTTHAIVPCSEQRVLSPDCQAWVDGQVEDVANRERCPSGYWTDGGQTFVCPPTTTKPPSAKNKSSTATKPGPTFTPPTCPPVSSSDKLGQCANSQSGESASLPTPTEPKQISTNLGPLTTSDTAERGSPDG